jgi:uncharacterized phiE125 gp8 family phage protein
MLAALTPANGEAILPLDLLKARVRVIADDENQDITRMRLQAIDFVERYSGVALQRRQFQWADRQFCYAMRLPIGPLESVDAIAYVAPDGTLTDLAEGDWYVGGGVLSAAAGKRWPYASGQAGAVRVTFTAGFEDAENEAPMLIAAVEVGVAALRASRDAPDWSGAMACADSYRMPGL